MIARPGLAQLDPRVFPSLAGPRARPIDQGLKDLFSKKVRRLRLAFYHSSGLIVVLTAAPMLRGTHLPWESRYAALPTAASKCSTSRSQSSGPQARAPRAHPYA